MPAFVVLMLAVQIGLAVHAIKSGREMYWVIIIILFPLLGAVAYVATQLLPDLLGSRQVRTAVRDVKRAVNPRQEVSRLRDQLELADNIDNRLALADACVEADLDREARDLYQSCLRDAYASDPHILLKLATTEFKLGEYGRARKLLERLIESNPGFRSPDGHLLYARSLEESGELEAALHEYEALADSYPGEEGRIRYALMLKQAGRIEDAVKQFNTTMLRCKRSPAYYRQSQRKWLEIAKDNLA